MQQSQLQQSQLQQTKLRQAPPSLPQTQTHVGRMEPESESKLRQACCTSTPPQLSCKAPPVLLREDSESESASSRGGVACVKPAPGIASLGLIDNFYVP